MLGLFAFLVLFYFLHDADGKERHKEHAKNTRVRITIDTSIVVKVNLLVS